MSAENRETLMTTNIRFTDCTADRLPDVYSRSDLVSPLKKKIRSFKFVALAIVAISGITSFSAFAGEGAFQIGDKVKFDDSEWEVVTAKEIGNVLRGNDFVEPKQSEGKFVYVQFKVVNTTSEEQAVLFTPALQDSEGRKFEELDDLEMYLGEGETGMTLEQLPAGLPKKFAAIFEVPAGATGFSFLTRSFAPFRSEEKAVSLGF